MVDNFATRVVATLQSLRAQSNDIQQQVYGLAPIDSPIFTGTPEAPTALVDTNTDQISTTSFVIGQGYLKETLASSTYAPIQSPSLTGNTSIVSDSSGTALRVTQSGSGAALLIEDSSNPDSTPFVIDATGNVGVGVLEPSYKIDVSGTINATSIYVNGAPLDLLPNQSGQTGKFLTTDGSVASWATVEQGGGNISTDVALSNSWWLGV